MTSGCTQRTSRICLSVNLAQDRKWCYLVLKNQEQTWQPSALKQSLCTLLKHFGQRVSTSLPSNGKWHVGQVSTWVSVCLFFSGTWNIIVWKEIPESKYNLTSLVATGVAEDNSLVISGT